MLSTSPLIQELRDQSECYPDRIALIQGQQVYTYNSLWRSVDRFASQLQSFGIHRGEVVIFCPYNSAEAIILYLALWQIAAIPFPQLEPESFFRYGIIPKAVVVQDVNLNPIGTFQDWKMYELDQDNLPRLRIFVNKKDQSVEPDDGTFIWISSSGTTHSPKVISLSHRGTLFNIQANVKSLKLSEKDTTLLILPLAYSYGLIGQFLSHLYAGAKIIIPVNNGSLRTNFKQIPFIPSLIQKEKITTLFTVPTVIRTLNSILSHIPSITKQLSQLRLLTIGGGSIDSFNLERILENISKTSIAVTYGLCEAGPRVSTCFVHETRLHSRSVGHPIEGVSVNIVDDHGDELPNGQEGEVRVTSPSVMKGYILNGTNNHCFIPEMKIDTGDLGKLSEDGFLYILGRKEQALSIDGLRVMPNQVQNIVYRHADVLHVFVRNGLSLLVIPQPQKSIRVDDLYDLLAKEYSSSARLFTIEVSYQLPINGFIKS